MLRNSKYAVCAKVHFPFARKLLAEIYEKKKIIRKIMQKIVTAKYLYLISYIICSSHLFHTESTRAEIFNKNYTFLQFYTDI